MQQYDINGAYIGKNLWNRGFVAMLVTQFTVAMNDNLFRWLLVPIGKDYFDGDIVRFLGGVFLLVPFLLWTSIAGYVTDKYSRRDVMIYCKLVELVLLALAVFVIVSGPAVEYQGFAAYLKVGSLLAILFMLGTQSTFFSPSKYGSIPDLVPKPLLSEANGVIAMTTMIACVSGQILGGYLYFWTTDFSLGPSQPSGIPGGQNWILTAACLVGIAGIGYIASFFVPKLKAVAPNAKFPKNFLAQTGKDLFYLFQHKWLFRIALASGFFWGLAAMAAVVIDKYAQEFLLVQQQHITVLAAILSIGIGVGAVIAGIASRGRIELGLVPVGAFGMGFFLLALGFTPAMPEGTLAGHGEITSVAYIFSAIFLFLTGAAAGLYDIPLAAFLQKESPVETRGRILAAYNFISFSAMLLFTCLFLVLAKGFESLTPMTGMPASLMLWIFCALMCLSVAGLLCYVFLVPLVNLILTFWLWAVYRPQILGLENVPKEGGALFVANHQSYLDGFLIYTTLEKPIRGVIHAHFIPGRFANYLADCVRAIRVLPGKKVVSAIKEARKALSEGDFLLVFPEGGITRTEQIKAFEPGFLSMLKGNEHLPIIPVYIGGLYGSMFSYAYGPIMKWIPRRLFRRPILSFGEPIYVGAVNSVHGPCSENTALIANEIHQAVEELGIDSLEKSTQKLMIPPRLMLRKLRNGVKKRVRLVDSTGLQLTSYEFLIRILVARRVLRRHLLSPDEKNVGLLIPLSVGGALANAALALDGRASVNLNYTFGSDTLNHCIKQADIKHVIISRKMLERFPDLKLDAEMFFIEDLMKYVTKADKLIAAFQAYCLPIGILERVLGVNKIKSEDPITIFFTSGSTGEPKGATITHNNLAENSHAFLCVFKVEEQDTFLGLLPPFHAYGYTTNLWPALLSDCSIAFHFNPLEPKKVGEMCRLHKCTIMACTPTFLRNYLRRCPKEDFASMYSVITGAEKLPSDLADAWEEKYGQRPGEGYGMTELSPVVAANCVEGRKTDAVPYLRMRDDFQPCYRDGSVGRPLPNLTAKIVDLETGETLPPNEQGMLWVKSPFLMQGYYKQPEKTAAVMRPGNWYVTGDVAKIDEDGFIFITGRISRMSKIGGEMCPHILIEEEIDKFVRSSFSERIEDAAVNKNDEGVLVAVTSLQDEKKGERIIVLHKAIVSSAEEIVKALQTTGMPQLWIPSIQHFRQVEELPLLGTGKLDLRSIKKMAEDLFSN